MSSEESDEPASSHALQNLLAEMPQQSGQRNIHLPTWSFPSAPVSRKSPSPGLAEAASSSTVFSPQSTSRNTIRPTSELDLANVAPSAQHPSLFSTPSRSIFSSGPPIASVSANTAHASMSAPPPGNSSNPLSALTGPSSTTNRRSVHYQLEEPSSARNVRMGQVEKDVDDPSTPLERDSTLLSRGATTPTALTRLFAAQETTPPTVSRHASYLRTPSGTTYTRGMSINSLSRSITNVCSNNRNSTPAKPSLHPWAAEWQTFGYHGPRVRDELCFTSSDTRPCPFLLVCPVRTLVRKYIQGHHSAAGRCRLKHNSSGF